MDFIKTNFTKEDYNSNDGMLTTVWGPPIWHFLHTMSFNYPTNPTDLDKTNYYNFVISFKNVLPCGKCRKNLAKNLKLKPLKMSHMKNRETFSRYIFELHEVVNTMLEKKSGLTYEIVRDRYEFFRARCFADDNNINSKENGCVNPIKGTKSQCVLMIKPFEDGAKSLYIDSRCSLDDKCGGVSTNTSRRKKV